MAKFRKIPVVTEAVQWNGNNMHEMKELMGEWRGYRWGKEPNELIIITPEGDMHARQSDWIIKGVKGEFYPCKPDIFNLTYEAV